MNPAFAPALFPARQRGPQQSAMVTMSQENTPSTPVPNTSKASIWARLNLDTCTLVSAHLSSSHDNDTVSAIWSQRDPIAAKKHLFVKSYILGRGSKYIPSQPAELSPPAAANLYPSPTRRLTARFVPHPKVTDKALRLEVWSEAGLEHVWPIEEAVHGAIYTDEWFGNVTWSPDERYIAYIAETGDSSEEREENEESEAGQSVTHSTSEKTKNKDPTSAWATPLAKKYDASARGPFGEQYVQRRKPALYIADLQTGAVRLAAAPKTHHLGEPQWSQTGWIVCTARKHTELTGSNIAMPVPDDLGIIYCYNRPNALVAFRAPATFDAVAHVEASFTQISDPEEPLDYCCNSPRFSPDGRELVYVSAPRLRDGCADTYILPHNTTKILRYVTCMQEGGFSKPTTLIDVPEGARYGKFPGLYLHGLVARPWLTADGLALTTTWGSQNKVVTVSFQRSGERLAPPATLSEVCITKGEEGSGNPDASKGSSTLMDTRDGDMLVAVTDAATPTQLVMLRKGDTNTERSAIWVSQTSPRAGSCLRDVLHEQHAVTLIAREGEIGQVCNEAARVFNAESDDDANLAYEVTLLLPKRKSDDSDAMTALAVCPHGGPHTSSIRGFTVAAAALLSCGFAVMYVNYRGSTGLGQASLESLLGRIGTQEVNEVVQATQWALQTAEFGLDATRTVFVGGSHSGFIGAHTSLVPGLFKRTVLRNPVVNVASMIGMSDIPDWCLAETGFRQEGGGGGMVADAKQLAVMYEHSPVSRVVKAKEEGAYPRTLLQVSGSDKRAPPGQSLEWRRLLTGVFGEGVVTMRWYEDCAHPIGEVPEGDDAWVQALDFLCEVFNEAYQGN